MSIENNTLIIKDAVSILKFLHIARLEEEYFKSYERYHKAHSSYLNENKDVTETEKALYKQHKEEKAVNAWGKEQSELAFILAKRNVFQSTQHSLTHHVSLLGVHQYGLTENFINLLQAGSLGGEKLSKMVKGISKTFLEEFVKLQNTKADSGSFR